MSSPHPTVSSWERDEHEGCYRAELHDWQLEVSWVPNSPEVRGHFVWKATKDDDSKQGERGFEEIELAMADAEQACHAEASPDGASPDSDT